MKYGYCRLFSNMKNKTLSIFFTYAVSFAFFCPLLVFQFSCQERTRKNENANQEAASPEKPNILFIAVDDLRPELGAYGASHIKSPSIDQLAAESLVLERAYCNVPVCGASRASLLSGIRPGRHRFIGYSTYLDKDYPGVTSLPRHFKNHGYHTISNGKIYHHADDNKDAWNEIWRPAARNGGSWRDYQILENIKLETEGPSRGLPYEKADVPDTAYFDGRIAAKTIDDLKKLKEKGSPFFMAVGFLKPHLPFNAPAKYWEMYGPEDIALPDNYLQPETTPGEAFHNSGELRAYADIPKKGLVTNEMAKKLIHGYYACVSYTDAQIGKLLTALQELGLDNNTVVILWGDHGWNLGDHQLWCKHCNFESSLHVPLLMKVPGQSANKRSDAIVEYIDIYPSLCEVAGLPVPEHLDGESFAGLLRGEKRQKDFAISKYRDGVTLVKDNLFYTEWLNDDNEVKARMLFDHTNDPLELNNLAAKPAYREKVNELSQLLRSNWGEDFLENRKQEDI